MRTLSNAQHVALERINKLAHVVGWDDDRQGPVLRAGSMECVITQDGTVEAR